MSAGRINTKLIRIKSDPTCDAASFIVVYVPVVAQFQNTFPRDFLTS